MGEGNVARVSDPTVLARVVGDVGHLTLNRPRAINALDLDMIRALADALDAWEHDDTVRSVLLDGAGERGLCAGGDVRGLRGRLGPARHRPHHRGGPGGTGGPGGSGTLTG